jgi:hypothetical protein
MAINGNFATLWAEYPWVKWPSKDTGYNGTWLENTLGGELKGKGLPNHCAIRLSYAMNHAGLKLPANYLIKYQNAQLLVFKGANNLYYAPDMTQLWHYIREKYGKQEVEVDLLKNSKESAISAIGTRKGIIIFRVKNDAEGKPLWWDAFGHATLWDGSKTGTNTITLPGGTETNDARTADHEYFDKSKTVFFWEVNSVSPSTSANNAVVGRWVVTP